MNVVVVASVTSDVRVLVLVDSRIVRLAVLDDWDSTAISRVMDHSGEWLVFAEAEWVMLIEITVEPSVRLAPQP